VDRRIFKPKLKTENMAMFLLMSAFLVVVLVVDTVSLIYGKENVYDVLRDICIPLAFLPQYIRKVNCKRIVFYLDFITIHRFVLRPIQLPYSTYEYTTADTIFFEKHSIDLSDFDNQNELADLFDYCQSFGLITFVEKKANKRERNRKLIIFVLSFVIYATLLALSLIYLDHQAFSMAAFGIVLLGNIFLFLQKNVIKHYNKMI
jgi:hypothetical protein